MAAQSSTILQGKIGWISGGAQGIGLELGKMLCSKGCRVVLVDVCSEEAGQAAANKCSNVGNATFLRCDVTDTAALRESLRKSGEYFGEQCPSIFVNNAGIVDEARRSQMMDINAKAVIEGCLAQEEMLSAAGMKGVIVNNASLAGLTPAGQTPAYDASKFACVGWTRSFAMKLSGEVRGVPHVRVNAVCPHLVDTPAVGAYYKSSWELKGGAWAKMAKHPMSASVVADVMMQLIEGDYHGAVALVTQTASWIPKFDQKAILTPSGTILARL